ncbi:hypothetical protein [Lentiprolixibacter aurantiacus]|uniref:Uncharacterized protein n=1 Tax=Lentiprolixibacter aurantiacus TaxID=2993939 RepID=A0AAE3MLY9_9FLAO|nr:hypothetical protein [Lentiprolixibacter aurantiacus]MCX2719633.1 hypothetical protein [Lentiprolixibacter aurantiacus]
MKQLKHSLKFMMILSTLLLMQSCYVSKPVSASELRYSYRSSSISMGKTSKPVKIIYDSNKYIFRYLINVDGTIYGVAGKESKTAKLLSKQIVNSKSFINSRLIRRNEIAILLTEEQANEVYPHSYIKSVIVALPIAFGVAYGLFYLTIINNI